MLTFTWPPLEAESGTREERDRLAKFCSIQQMWAKNWASDFLFRKKERKSKLSEKFRRDFKIRQIASSRQDQELSFKLNIS